MKLYLHLSKLPLFLAALLCLLSLSSFSLLPVEADRSAPPVEKKTAAKHHVRKQKRHARLNNRLSKARTQAQKQRILKRIQQHEQTKRASPAATTGMILSIIGFVFGLLSIVMLFVFGGGFAIAILAIIFGILFVAIALGLGIAGLVVSAAGLRTTRESSEYGSVGVPITGIVLGSLAILAFFVFFVILFSGAWL